MKIMKSRRQRVYERLYPYAVKYFKPINVKAGTYLGNKKCQHNSLQILHNGEADTVAVTLSFVPRSGVNVHFLNRKKRTYIDNTLGYLSKKNTYFLIKEYTLDELDGINMTTLLNDFKRKMLDKVFNKLELFIFRIGLNKI